MKPNTSQAVGSYRIIHGCQHQTSCFTLKRSVTALYHHLALLIHNYYHHNMDKSYWGNVIIHGIVVESTAVLPTESNHKLHLVLYFFKKTG